MESVPDVHVGNHWRSISPTGRAYRFIGLFFMCFLGFGNYFVYDNPAALADQFVNILGLSASSYSLLYSIYSWPNAVLSLFGGFFIDRFFGIRLGAVIFAVFVAVGQIIFALGVIVNRFWLMILGRFVFAIGGESLAVAQNTYAVKWFKGKELMTVFGIQLSFARVGSSINMFSMMPLFVAIKRHFSSGSVALGTALMCAAAFTVMSVLFSLVLVCLDRKRDDRLQIESEQLASTSAAVADGGAGSIDNAVSWRDVLRLPLSLWLLSLICVTYYVAIFPFVGFGVLFFERKYQLEPYDADICNSLIYLLSIVGSPLMGIVMDYTGRNLMWVTIGTSLALAGHILFAFTFLTPYVPMLVLGISYSTLAASLWPCVAMVVERRILATAYGLMQSLQNLGLGLLFLSAGAIVDARGYLIFEMYLIIWLCVCLGFCMILWIVDASSTNALNLPRSKRESNVEYAKIE